MNVSCTLGGDRWWNVYVTHAQQSSFNIGGCETSRTPNTLITGRAVSGEMCLS